MERLVFIYSIVYIYGPKDISLQSIEWYHSSFWHIRQLNSLSSNVFVQRGDKQIYFKCLEVKIKYQAWNSSVRVLSKRNDWSCSLQIQEPTCKQPRLDMHHFEFIANIPVCQPHLLQTEWTTDIRFYYVKLTQVWRTWVLLERDLHQVGRQPGWVLNVCNIGMLPELKYINWYIGIHTQ